MQPISTNRSPCSGSSPVVSVSKTISRIADPPAPVCRGASGAAGESLPTRLHSSDGTQNVAHLRTGAVEIPRAVHDEIGTPALFGVGHLLGQDRREFLFSHAGPFQHAPALLLGRGRNHHYGVAA